MCTFQPYIVVVIHVVNSFTSPVTYTSDHITLLQRTVLSEEKKKSKKLVAIKTQDRLNKASLHLYRRVQALLPVDILCAAAKNQNVLGFCDDSSVP